MLINFILAAASAIVPVAAAQATDASGTSASAFPTIIVTLTADGRI